MHRSNPEGNYKQLYTDETPLFEKVTTVCTKIYGAGNVIASPAIKTKLEKSAKRALRGEGRARAFQV